MRSPRHFLRRIRPAVAVLAASAAVPLAVAPVLVLAVGRDGPATTPGGPGGSLSATELGIEVSRTLPEPSRPVPRSSGTVPQAQTTPGPVARAAPAPPAGSFVTPGRRLGIAGCDLFPPDHAFRAHIGALALHPRSDRMIDAAGGAGLTLNAGFSATPWQGSRPGYPVNIADSRDPGTNIVSVIARTYHGTSDLDGHPVPAVPRYEGWPSITWDRHLLVVDPATCTSHEMIGVTPPVENPLGAWFVDKAVRIDLSSNGYRPRGSVKVAGVSMLAGLVRYDEVASGSVGHVISMSMPAAGAGVVWPARWSDGPSEHPDAPPMGAWLRLRADADLSGLGPQARVIAQALRDHGGVIADTGMRFALSGEPDVRWDDADLRSLNDLSLADFEVVDPSPMVTDRSTLRIR